MKVFQHHHIGQRTYQEDALGYHPSAFVVCDGVGGHGNGDLASKTVLKFLLDTSVTQPPSDIEQLEELIIRANSEINALLTDQPDKEGMGTTLAGIFKIGQQWLSTHIGDSRVYWVKPSDKKFWHTWDHSFVANLVKMGEISREAARNHPRSNEIQKAILANAAGHCAKPDIQALNGLQTGDLILICSDGLTEAWSDEELLQCLCDTTLSSEDKAQNIFEQCQATSRDNNTAILLEWEARDVEDLVADNSQVAWTNLGDLTVEPASPQPMSKKPWWKRF